MAAYISDVRQRHRRVAIAELRSGVHWGAEELDRLRGRAARPPAERVCEHCAARGLGARAEDTRHILFDCVLYADLRRHHPDLFPEQQQPTLASLLDGPPEAVACFVGACRRRGRRAAGLPP